MPERFPLQVGEKVIREEKGFKEVERFYAGWCPELKGRYIHGWTGTETVVRETLYKLLHTVNVIEIPETKISVESSRSVSRSHPKKVLL